MGAKSKGNNTNIRVQKVATQNILVKTRNRKTLSTFFFIFLSGNIFPHIHSFIIH